MIRFKLLAENRENEELGLKGEGGLSVVVQVDDKEFLIDTGYSCLFVENAKKLGVDLNKIELVVLTHGHSDHTNGVPFLSDGKTIVMHPEALKKRYSVRKKEYAGFPVSEEELKSKHNVVLSKQPVQLSDEIFFIGEVPMVVDFESKGNFSTTLDDEFKIEDKTEDDSGVAIKTENGLVVITGCGHRGVCNTIERAKEITGEQRVFAAFGGFHLRKLEKQKEIIDRTIEYFKSNNLKHLYLGHCVTDEVIEYISSKLPEVQIHRLQTGKEFKLEENVKIKI